MKDAKTYQVGAPLAGLEANTESAYPPENDSLVGLRAALTPVVTPGKTIVIEGPPSEVRDTDTENSVDSVKERFDTLRNDPTGIYQEVHKNFLTTRYAAADLDTFAGHAHERYEKLILRHVPSPQLTKIESEHFTLVYPPGYSGNKQAVSVPTRRITIHAVDRFGDARHLVAYFANYDKVDPQQASVVFQINGHYGHNPCRLGLGIEDRGSYSGGALGKFALRGIPLISYDDHDVGESSPATGKENGQYRTLANMRMMDDALLVHFKQVDGIGISGGCERLYHFLMFHRCRLATAYLSGMFRPAWYDLYHWRTTGGKRGVDHDTFNEEFYANFQWADLVLVGIQRKVNIRVASMTYEGASGKQGLVVEMLPAIRHYTDRISVGGDDRDGDGVSDDGRNLSHEYDIADYTEFLANSQK